ISRPAARPAHPRGARGPHHRGRPENGPPGNRHRAAGGDRPLRKDGLPSPRPLRGLPRGSTFSFHGGKISLNHISAAGNGIGLKSHGCTPSPHRTGGEIAKNAGKMALFRPSPHFRHIHGVMVSLIFSYDLDRFHSIALHPARVRPIVQNWLCVGGWNG